MKTQKSTQVEVRETTQPETQKTAQSEIINEHILALSGKVSLPEPMKMDHDYTLGLTVNIHKIEKVSRQQNNEYNFVYRALPIGSVVIEKDFGKQIIATARGKSLSKRFRDKCFVLGEDYDVIMGKLLSDDDLIYLIKNKL